jgi:hypothetical protein
VVRVEVHLRKDDAALVRSVARALSDPAVETETRVLLRERLGVAKAKGLKELLASAPLEGRDLTRKRDAGRKLSCELPARTNIISEVRKGPRLPLGTN